MNRLYVENEKVMNEAQEIDLTRLCVAVCGSIKRKRERKI